MPPARHAQAFELLGVENLMLDVLALGDVDDARQRALIGSVVVEDGRGGHGDHDLAAVFRLELEVVQFLAALRAILHLRGGDVAAVLVHEVEEVAPQHLLFAVAEHAGHGRIDEGAEALGVDLPDALLGQLDQTAVFLLAGHQRHHGSRSAEMSLSRQLVCRN